MADTTDALLNDLHLIASQGETPDGDGVAVNVQLWAERWVERLATPAGSASGEAGILCHRLHTSDGKNAWRWVNGAPNEQAKDDARNFGWPLELAYSGEYIAALQAEVARLNAIINAPQSDDFLRAVSTEAEHQRQRWGTSHDSGKSPPDWFWLIGYLAGKALHAHIAGSVEKAEHHIITTAAACANWHRAMFGHTDMRPGIDGDAAMGSANGQG